MVTDSEKLDVAIEHHQAGRLQQAEDLYQEILSKNAQHADAQHLLGLAWHQLGRHEAGIESIRQALALQPRSVVYLTNLGAVYHATKRFDEAIESYCRALEVKPDHGSALANLALTLRARGKFLDLVARYESIVRKKPSPDFGAAHECLGNILKAQGNLRAAEVTYRQALQFNPKSAELNNSLGMVLKRNGKLDEAIAAYQRALQINPKLIASLNNLGNALTQRGQLVKAGHYFQQALVVDPDNATVWVNLGVAQKEQRDLENAVTSFRRALDLKPDYAMAHYNLGAVLVDRGQQEEADTHFHRALKIAPSDPDAHYNLAISLATQGDFEKAIASYEQAAELRPDYVMALKGIAECLDRTQDKSHVISRLEGLLANSRLPQIERRHGQFALGKIYDDRGEWKQAFGHYEQANALVEKTYDDRSVAQIVSKTIETCTKALLDSGSTLGVKSDLPVFIVGMPRSGTTLVERVLAGHPEIFGAGELPNIARMAQDLPTRLGSNVDYLECLKELDGATCARLADEYLTYLRNRCDKKIRVTDKMPGNFMHLGLIALILPEARVIHCRRHPLDTCLSCFFQDFTYANGLNFAFDLRNLGYYYRHYVTLMKRWREVLPLRFMEVDYEDLVTDQEEASRKLIEFCGVKWAPAPLDASGNHGVIRTASLWQARQPIYTTSIGRWRHYEEFLGPLKEALQWVS